MLEQFKESKKHLIAFVNEIKSSSFIDKDIVNNSRIDAEVQRLEEGDFKISLVAPFSAGKSTFINAIIGKDILSMDIRAETSVITKISYSKDIKLKIIYNSSSKVEIIDKDLTGQALTYESCKEVLKKITTVRDESNEVNIKEVVVYCPLDICRDNVELIDTPGLFSRHEKHESITNNILPQVNAVIFMIDPDSVGEEHFTDKIQNYVGSAKNSNLEEDGKHIFFVINKIDVFDPEDIEKSRAELVDVLREIINKPQIHEVSAYLGMVGKQLQSGDLPIEMVQKDRKIKIPDPMDPDYTISGRAITEDNANDIISFSRIKELERALGDYLQSKNEYLLKDVKVTIQQILSDSINKMKYQVGEIKQSMNQNNKEYLEKIDNLKQDIKELQEGTVENIKKIIKQRIGGGLSGGALDDVFAEHIRKQIIDVAKDLDRFVFSKWTKAKRGIDRYNAEDIVQDVILQVQDELSVKAKEIVKSSFLSVKSIIESLMEDIQYQFELIDERIEAAEMKNLGKSMDKIGNISVESLIGNISKQVEKEFSNVVVSVAKDFNRRIEESEKDATKMVEKKGFWYGVKVFFTGKRQYDEVFDAHEFRRQLDKLMDELSGDILEDLQKNERAIRDPLIDAVNNIVSELRKEVEAIISSVVKVKEKILNDVKQDMSKNKDEKDRLIKEKEAAVQKILEMQNRFNKQMAGK